jgi:hypothetical protein
MTLVDIFVTVMMIKLAKKMWNNWKLRARDMDAFRAKYASQELNKFIKASIPKARLTHAQFAFRIFIVFMILEQFSWIPRK